MLEPRRPAAGDLSHYEALFTDPVVAKVLLDPPPQRILDGDLAHWERDGWGPWAWFEDCAFVGRGGLLRTGVGGAPSVEVLYALVTPASGRGLATEIARRSVAHAWELGLPEVVGFAWTENPASIRVLERAGLVYERQLEHAGLPHWFGRAQRPV